MRKEYTSQSFEKEDTTVSIALFDNKALEEYNLDNLGYDFAAITNKLSDKTPFGYNDGFSLLTQMDYNKFSRFYYWTDKREKNTIEFSNPEVFTLPEEFFSDNSGNVGLIVFFKDSIDQNQWTFSSVSFNYEREGGKVKLSTIYPLPESVMDKLPESGIADGLYYDFNSYNNYFNPYRCAYMADTNKFDSEEDIKMNLYWGSTVSEYEESFELPIQLPDKSVQMIEIGSLEDFLQYEEILKEIYLDVNQIRSRVIACEKNKKRNQSPIYVYMYENETINSYDNDTLFEKLSECTPLNYNDGLYLLEISDIKTFCTERKIDCKNYYSEYNYLYSTELTLPRQLFTKERGAITLRVQERDSQDYTPYQWEISFTYTKKGDKIEISKILN